MLRRAVSILTTITILAAIACTSALVTAPASAETWTPLATGGIEGNFKQMAFGSQLVEYNSKLYALTDGPASGCKVIVSSGTGGPPYIDWAETSEQGFGDSNNYWASSGVGFDGYLYVGTGNGSGCQVWRTAEIGGPPYTDWERVATGGFGNAQNTRANCMHEFGGKLYVGTQNYLGGTGQIWATSGGVSPTWEKVSDANIESGNEIFSMVQFGTYLHTGTSNGVYRTDASGPAPYTWTQVADVSIGYNCQIAVSEDGNTLYAACRTADDTFVSQTDGSGGPPYTWTRINTDGFGDPNENNPTSITIFDSHLYVGTDSQYDPTKPLTGGQLWRYDGPATTDWVKVATDGFGDVGNYQIISMLEFDGLLHVSTMNSVSPGAPFTHGTVVMSTAGSGGPPYTDWTRVNEKGFSPNENTGACLAFYNNSLYAGTSNWAGCEVWRNVSGTWTQVNQDGFGDIWNSGVFSLVSWNGYLYAATSNMNTGGEIWRYNGTIWETVATPGFGSTENAVVGYLTVKGSYLYAGTYDHDDGNCEIWRTAGGAAPHVWTQVNTDGFGDSAHPYLGCMATDGTYLYAGTAYTTGGCQLWRSACSGAAPFTDWRKVNSAGFGDTSMTNVDSIAFLGTGLYVGTSGSASGCKVLRSFKKGGPPYTDWKTVNSAGFGDADNYYASSLAVMSWRLFAGTGNFTDGCDVWKCATTGGPPFTDWSRIGTRGMGSTGNVSASGLVVSGSYMYAAAANNTQGCQVLRTAPIFPAPTVTGITPAEGNTENDVSITNLAGTGFTGSGATVKLKRAGQADITATSVQIPSTSRITCDLDLDGAQPGTWDVYVYNADGQSGRKVGAFTVKPVYPTWYLAEGTTAWGFSTYISIANPNAQDLNAQVTYMPTGSAPVTETVSLPAQSQTTLTNDHLTEKMGGAKDFSTRVDCTDHSKTIAVDRTMTWTGGGAGAKGSGARGAAATGTGVGQEAHNSVGVPSPSGTWYLPEGSSDWGFECWLLIQNPNAGTANCTLTYMIEGQGPKAVKHTVDPNSRATFNMADDIGDKDASVMVTSDREVIPERAMYRAARREGHDSIGTTTPALEYYLAEGTSAWGFTTYVLVQNPQASETDVNITYMTSEGPIQHPETIKMPAGTRKTIRVNDVAGMSQKDFSTLVRGSQPVIAERAMYWYSPTGEACHDSVGMDSAHEVFYLPDGQTSEGRETWTLVQNPNASGVEVQVSYLPAGGGAPVVKSETIPGSSRMTFGMREHSGIDGRASIMVECKTVGKKIMVERAMYWDSRGAGTDTIGGCSD